MAQMVKITNYDAPELDVVLNPDNLFEIGVQVTNTGVDAGDDGRKIIKAGTPVGHSTDSVLVDRDTVLVVTNGDDDASYAQGVLRHDVDVTAGQTNATLVVRGEVDLSKCPEIHEDAITALTHIIFVDGGKY